LFSLAAQGIKNASFYKDIASQIDAAKDAIVVHRMAIEVQAIRTRRPSLRCTSRRCDATNASCNMRSVTGS
jgi:hypothetical protein